MTTSADDAPVSGDETTADQARWRQVQSLLDAALDLPASERAVFLDRSCGTDTALRDEVAQLLRACDDSGDFLEQPVSHAAGALVARELEALESIPAGTRIGPYRVLHEIGRGGMGVVCLAERDDGEYRKRVALKVVLRRPGMEDWTLRRFREERQLLASLEHPGIARMLDGGMSDGTPWFAMEYVDGLPIDEYCAAHALTVDACLELFAAVCDVVQYAHDRTIVHRDLKPFNILVVDGKVKLLDFGIASLTSGNGTAQGGDETPPMSTLQSMTPGYASPEQMRGEPATAASDVYSLGVLLRHLSPPQPNSEAPGALKAILDTALHSDPGHRYQSAGALATAVRAYLGARARAGSSRRPLVRYATAAAAVFAIVIAGTLVTRGSAARSPYVSSTIAVLPFEPAVADSALQRLGRDLAITLSADLDGVGDIRTADPHAVLSRRPAMNGRSSLSADMALVSAIGAGRLVRGSITRSGALVRVDAILYASDASAPLARASTTLPPENIAAATDSLRAGLLRQLWRGRSLPATSLAALSTRSTAALRAYLDGERLVLEYRMPEAATAFETAIQADSTFWFAYWRLAWAREFAGGSVDGTITAAYQAHRGEFPERDRLLIDARMAPRLRDRIDLSHKVIERFPTYWPAWLDYAEVLVHQGPYAGHRLAEAREPLERAVRLNPRLVAAWDHLMWVALTELDTVASGKVLSTLERFNYDSAAIDRDNLQMLIYYRYLDGLARSGGVPDTALLGRMGRFLSKEGPGEGRMQGGMSRYGFHRARIALSHRVLQHPQIRRKIVFEWRARATTWASRGAFDSALVAVDSATAIEPEPGQLLFGYRLATIGAWLGMLDTTTANARRIDATRAFDRLPPAGRAEMAWIDGVLAAARRDRVALGEARVVLAGIELPGAALLDSSLMALELDVAGRRREAINVLMAVEVDRYHPNKGQHPYFAGINRLALSGWLRDAGRREEAARLLVWHEAVVHPDGQTAHANALLAGPAYFERARLEDLLGHREVARVYYQQFLRRLDLAPPSHQHLVREARAALSRDAS